MSTPVSPQNYWCKRELSEGYGDSLHPGVSCVVVGEDSRTVRRWLQATFMVQTGIESQLHIGLCVSQRQIRGRLISKSPHLDGQRETELRSRATR